VRSKFDNDLSAYLVLSVIYSEKRQILLSM
jgi:hypothetical protein